MKIYVVAHENIVCPKKYRKIEIDMEQEYVRDYILKSVAYQDMLENLEEIVSNAPVDEEEYADYLVNSWLSNQVEEFYKTGYYDLGDFYLVIEN